MTVILAEQSAQLRADRLIADYRPSDQRRLQWLQIECSRCKTPRDVDLAVLEHPPTTCVHYFASQLRCEKCKKARQAAGGDAAATRAVCKAHDYRMNRFGWGKKYKRHLAEAW